MRRVLLAVGLLLVLAPAARAGGWATVGLSSTPDGTAAGKAWVVDITVLQHGRTPLTDVKPVVTISSGGKRQDFAATPTGDPGVYRAAVVFPSAGRWEYEIDDGFISQQPHTYPAVEIGGPAAAAPPTPARAAVSEDGGGPNLVWLIGGIALLLAAGAVLLARSPRWRRRRHAQHPQAA